MNDKDVIIIGAGISGLSAGIYLQMNGYQTAIFEQHNLPGGACTGWYKDGYYIDGCIHWLMGTKEGTGYNRMWEELTVLRDVPIYYPDTFLTMILSDGSVFEIKKNREVFIQNLKSLAPEDMSFIQTLEQSLRDMEKADVFFDRPEDIARFYDKLKAMKQLGRSMKTYAKYSKLTIGELLQTLTSPLLKEVLHEIMKMDDFAAISLFTTLNNFFTNNGGIPQGGSLGLSKRLAARYKHLGGELFLRTKVQHIEIAADNQATGIKLEDGTIIEGKRVISAIDGFATYHKLLSGNHMNEKMKTFYSENRLFDPLVICSYGGTDRLEDLPHTGSIPIEDGIYVGEGLIERRLTFRVQNLDPTLNKKRGAVLQVNFFTNWDYWNTLHQNEEDYSAQKLYIAQQVQDAIEKTYPQLKGRLKSIDVATPKTFAYYTNVSKGAFEGWKLTPGNIRINIPKKIDGLHNVYHIGQWTTPGGGVSIAAKDGRNIAYILCHEDRKKFLCTFD